MTVHQPAKRGDLVALKVSHRDYFINSAPTNRVGYEVGVVTNITREGKVKAVRLAWMSDGASVVPIARILGLEQVLVQSKTTIDVEAALATARAHTYPNAATIKAYETREELLAAMAPHRIEATT